MLDLKLLYKMLETPSISGYELEFQKMLTEQKKVNANLLLQIQSLQKKS